MQSLQKIQQRIAQAATSSGRQTKEVQLLAVSKKQPVSLIQAAYRAGQTCFGENYVQDAVDKIKTLQNFPLEWHFIGKLQSNKCREIAQYFTWVQGVEQLKHASLLNQYRQDHEHPMQVCLQVNLTHESSKSGVVPEAVFDLAGEISHLPHITLRGLMTMSNPKSTSQEKYAVFQQLTALKNTLQQQGLPLDTLSMGMSDDFELAIQAGSTMVRIGTSLFGARIR